MSTVPEGHYYRKQLGCDSSVIAWSHRSRFEMGLKLIGKSPGSLLDYGSGDGTFLAMAADVLTTGWGADIEPGQVKDCQTRFVAHPNISFSTIPELADPRHTAAYDYVTCMETLEHCTPPIVEVVLSDLARLVAPTGKVLISVPIEIGPTFVIKAVVRKAAAIRGLSEYRSYERYSASHAVRMLFSTKKTAVERPVYGTPESPSHSHYGFNWRALRERASQHLIVEKTLFSPVGWLGGWVSSQAWFICRARPKT